MARNIKINGVTFTDVDYVQIPKADGSGVAIYRDLSNFRSAINISDLVAGTATEINDVNGEVTGSVSNIIFYDYDALVSVNFPKAISTSGNTFRLCSNLETVKMNSCRTITDDSLRDCPNLSLVELDEVTSFGNYVFNSSTNFGTLVIGKTNCPSANVAIFKGTKIANGTGAIYVYADWIGLCRTQGAWASFATQIMLAETYRDPTALEYNVTVTPPTGYKPYVKYTTSKGEWYGRDRVVVGGSTDVVSYVASCLGLVNKSGSVNIDSSNPAISLDLSDMVVDDSFSGYNIINLDFTNAEIDYSNNCTVSYTNFADWYYNLHSTDGIGGFTNQKYLVLTQTIPSTAGMTTPTVVWEALVDLTTAGSNTRRVLYSCGSAAASAFIQIGASEVDLYRNSVNNVVSDLDLTNGWHHIGVVINATNSYIYVDGELKLTVTDSGMYAQFTSATQRFGNRWSSANDYFLGIVKKLVTCIRDINDPTILANCRFLLLQEIQS